MFNEFPALETRRLMLRTLTADDLDFVFRHFTDPDINRYLLDEEPITTRRHAQEIIDFYSDPAAKPYNRWLIVTKSEARPIGTCGYHKWQKEQFRAEIGYDLEKASWHQGFMTEALTAAIAFGFNKMALNRVEALVAPENLASVRLLERLGFQKEGLLRDYFYRNGTFYDHWLLSLLKVQWNSGKRIGK